MSSLECFVEKFHFDATVRKAFPVDEGEKAAFERGPISLQSSLDCLPR